MAEEVPGPHVIPQHLQVRAAAPGRRWDAVGSKLTGGTATLVVIYCPVLQAWGFYLDCDPEQAVLVRVKDIAPIAEALARET